MVEEKEERGQVMDTLRLEVECLKKEKSLVEDEKRVLITKLETVGYELEESE